MTRPLRIEFPRALYHVTARCDDKQRIFMDDNDRNRFLQIFGDIHERYQWITYAWCLMDGQYHFVIETPQPNLSKGIKLLNGIYTQYFNYIHGRVGHLFQGRYKSILVDKERYLIELVRHVVLEPVRNNLVEKPEDWLWSSYRHSAGLAPSPQWLNREWILEELSPGVSGSEKKSDIYKTYILEGIGQGKDLMNNVRQQIYLGDEDFISAVQSKTNMEGDLIDIARVQKRSPLNELEEFEARYANRKEAMAMAYFSGNYSQAEIARYFGVHYNTVSRAVKEFKENKV